MTAVTPWDIFGSRATSLDTPLTSCGPGDPQQARTTQSVTAALSLPAFFFWGRNVVSYLSDQAMSAILTSTAPCHASCWNAIRFAHCVHISIDVMHIFIHVYHPWARYFVNTQRCEYMSTFCFYVLIKVSVYGSGSRLKFVRFGLRWK